MDNFYKYYHKIVLRLSMVIKKAGATTISSIIFVIYIEDVNR